MAARLTGGTTRAHLAQYGLDPLTPEEGLEPFEQAVRSGLALTVAAALDPERLRSYLEEDGEEEERGGIPPFYRSVEPTRRRQEQQRQQKGAKDGRGWHLRKALSEAALERTPPLCWPWAEKRWLRR